MYLAALALHGITNYHPMYCRRPPQSPKRCIYSHLIGDCDYLRVYVGTLESRAR